MNDGWEIQFELASIYYFANQLKPTSIHDICGESNSSNQFQLV